MTNLLTTLAKVALNDLHKFDGNLEDSVVAQAKAAQEKYGISAQQSDSLYWNILEEAENMELKDRAQYVKNSSETCEKWYDPRTDKTFYVNVVNGQRDWNAAC